MTESNVKTAAGKRGPGRPPKSDAPAFDFGTVEFREAEMPAREKAPNPFAEAVGWTYEFDKARAVTLPAAQVTRATGLIRRAADDLEIGVSVDAGEPDKDGNVEIVFQGKERRKRKAKAATEETTEETAEEPTEGTTEAPEPTPQAQTEAVA